MCQQCRNSKKRKTAWSPERPTRWQPHTIENPESGLYFSDASAWWLIADLLETGQEFKEFVLKKPSGAKGYKALHELSNGKVLYIKIEIVGNFIWGRSFHPDNQ